MNIKRFDNAMLQDDGSVLMIQDGRLYQFTAEEFRRTFGYSAELIFRSQRLASLQ
jgi:hypothetical protein